MREFWERCGTGELPGRKGGTGEHPGENVIGGLEAGCGGIYGVF